MPNRGLVDVNTPQGFCPAKGVNKECKALTASCVEDPFPDRRQPGALQDVERVLCVAFKGHAVETYAEIRRKLRPRCPVGVSDSFEALDDLVGQSRSDRGEHAAHC